MTTGENVDMDTINTYNCAECGGTFPKVVSDEEALAEYKQNFPDYAEQDAVLVCDDCYHMLRALMEIDDIVEQEYAVNETVSLIAEIEVSNEQ